MADSLAELFDAGEDSNLCDRLFVRICEVHGNGADASSLSEEERTVYLVWAALGVVGNRGFRYLFESDVAGDPYYGGGEVRFQEECGTRRMVRRGLLSC
jgi:hypothetical protein